MFEFTYFVKKDGEYNKIVANVDDSELARFVYLALSKEDGFPEEFHDGYLHCCIFMIED